MESKLRAKLNEITKSEMTHDEIYDNIYDYMSYLRGSSLDVREFKVETKQLKSKSEFITVAWVDSLGELHIFGEEL